MTHGKIEPGVARSCRWLIALLLVGLPWIATGQLTISAGVQKYGALTGATVNMSGNCELWITNSSTPLSGCTINLNSVDAYLVLPGVKPSIAASATYMNQVRISGTVAVADSNCRVVEYAMGAIIAPHPASFQPLTVYSGPNFTGSVMALGQWNYYKANLGAMYANISSFKLKRGYMAVMAQAENGTGVSKCYIAADGDMEVSLLPSSLDNNIRFIRVTPWRWVSKKGAAGWISGQFNAQVQSWYGWREMNNSSRDLEYTAMQWAPFLPNLDHYNWQSAQVNTILGYNEPDRPDQSNMSVSSGIQFWPKLQEYGLRLGSPVPAEGGNWWLTDFMDQADAANLRVDFVAVHRYACYNPAGDPEVAADQLISALKSFYNQYKKPIWLTEWNSGAGWTGCGDPTREQHAALIEAMTRRMDEAPWVERYQIYSWVESSRNLTDGSGNLYPAGQEYVALQSPVGYVQALEDPGTRHFAELRFENDVLDSSGYGNNGIATGSPDYTSGIHGQAIVFDGTNTVVTLPPNVSLSSAFTFAAWVKWDGGTAWQRIFDFGDDETHSMFLTTKNGSGNLRFAIANGTGTEQNFDASPMPSNQWVHIAFTLSGGTGRIYTNGVQAGTGSISHSPTAFAGRWNTLGRSQYFSDPKFKGLMDDVFVADSALSATAVAQLMTNLPPVFTNSTIDCGSATEGVAYNGTLAGTATDANGQAVGYSKVNGPAWLSIASNGALTGTPTVADGGTNYFTVTVTDSTGGGPGNHGVATVQIVVTTLSNFNSAVWAVDASANWGTAGSWNPAAAPGGAGQTADFSAINITANRTVTLESARIIGSLTFNDTSGSESWTLASSGGSTLTLDSGSAASPSVAVNNSVTISASLAGTNGFNKTGSGVLTLSGSNAYLSGSVKISQGTVNVGNTYGLGTDLLTMNGGALSNASGSYLIDNPVNLASASILSVASGATLKLSGIITNSGGLTKEGSGRLMLAGASTYSGNTVLNAGTLDISGYGSSPLGNSTLIINGGSIDNSVIRQSPLTANNPQVWNGNFTFIGTEDLDLGSGNVTLNGVRQVTINAGTLSLGGIVSGSGGLIKAGSGILYLTGFNDSTYSGGTTINAGELQISDSQALGTGGLTFNGGTLSARQGSRTPANAVTVGGNFTLNGANAGGNLLTLAGTVNLGGVTRTITVDATGGATISGQISNGGLTKAGAGLLYLTVANTYAGGTILNAGELQIANNSSLGTGGLTINSGTLSARTGSRTPTNAVTVGGAFTLNGSGGGGNLLTLAGNVNLGGSTRTITVDATGGAAISGQISNGGITKSGTNVVTLSAANTYSGDTRIAAGTLTLGNVFALQATTLDMNVSDAGALGLGSLTAAVFGGLEGARNLSLLNGSSAAVALTVGGNGQSTTYSGVLSGTGSLTKTGLGTLTLSGANTFSGATTIGQGTLALSGSGSINNTPSITISNGAVFNASAGSFTLGSGKTLNGNGTVTGTAIIYGTVSPGTSIGSLTFSSPPTLSGTTLMEISRTNLPNADRIIISSGTLTYGGTLTVTNSGTSLQAGDNFQLFSASSYTGAFNATNLPPLDAGLQWNFNPAAGVLSVVPSVATNPTNILASVSGGTLTLSWPADHTGWTLLTQTNPLGVGLASDWFPVPGSSVTNRVDIPIDLSEESVFYRLVYPSAP